MSQRAKEILDAYEKNERFLNSNFLDAIPWDEVHKHDIDESFLPILIYMRDVEAFTDMYYQQMMQSPTGKDPVIRRFMDRWQHEELLHAELLNRFLEELGYPTDSKWYEKACNDIPNTYKLKQFLTKLITQSCGKRFSAVHMTWGAINELSTLQGYRRLWEQANHPVLEHILKGIAREESSHIFFYHSIARLKLEESKQTQRLARFMVETFWSPVGQGTKPRKEVDYVVQQLFSGEYGLQAIRQNVNGSLQKLPGFEGTTKIIDRIEEVIFPKKAL